MHMFVRRFLLGLVLAGCGLPNASAASFDAAHPDQYFRSRAAQAIVAGRPEAAVEAFRSAARYGDKPSQLALAFAYWTGEGVAEDRALGYVWADLAAERGVPAFLAVRERMWQQLTDDERARAQQQGAALAAEYQDAVAQPRLERLLRRGARTKTGSRTGSAVYSTAVSRVDPAGRAAMAADIYSAILSNVGPTDGTAGLDSRRDAYLAAVDGLEEVKPEIVSVVGGSYGTNMVKLLGIAFQAADRYSGAGYYDPANWDPKLYWDNQDAPWRDLPVGAVTIGPLSRSK